MKFQLTTASSYVPSWGIYEGVRELLQNAADAHDLGNEMKVSHRESTLRIATKGVKLDPKVWLLGTSSKVGREDQRGQFGEGFQLGILALVRAGLEVKIVNDDESWIPTLEDSEAFAGEPVLTVRTHKRQQGCGEFVVTVSGLPKELWEEMRERFLFLVKPTKMTPCGAADVILDEKYKGRVYVKGIFVEMNPKLECGYNLHNVKVDRDRRMVDRYDAELAMAGAWAVLATKTPALIRSHLLPMLERGAADVVDMHYRASDATIQALVDEFLEKYGDSAIPVRSLADSREVEHFGKHGVVQPEMLVNVLEKRLGKLDDLKKLHATAITKSWSWSELTDEERATWGRYLPLIEKAAEENGFPKVEERVTLVDFRDPKLNGTFEAGSIQLARHVLTRRGELVRVLVHEVSHGAGGDGEKAHERAEGKMMASIIVGLVEG